MKVTTLIMKLFGPKLHINQKNDWFSGFMSFFGQQFWSYPVKHSFSLSRCNTDQLSLQIWDNCPWLPHVLLGWKKADFVKKLQKVKISLELKQGLRKK